MDRSIIHVSPFLKGGKGDFTEKRKKGYRSIFHTIVLIENLLKYAWLFDPFLKFNVIIKGGKYVYTKCLKNRFKKNC